MENQYFPAGQANIDNLPDDGWTQDAIDELAEQEWNGDE